MLVVGGMGSVIVVLASVVLWFEPAWHGWCRNRVLGWFLAAVGLVLALGCVARAVWLPLHLRRTEQIVRIDVTPRDGIVPMDRVVISMRDDREKCVTVPRGYGDAVKARLEHRRAELLGRNVR